MYQCGTVESSAIIDLCVNTPPPPPVGSWSIPSGSTTVTSRWTRMSVTASATGYGDPGTCSVSGPTACNGVQVLQWTPPLSLPLSLSHSPLSPGLCAVQKGMSPMFCQFDIDPRLEHHKRHMLVREPSPTLILHLELTRHSP